MKSTKFQMGKKVIKFYRWLESVKQLCEGENEIAHRHFPRANVKHCPVHHQLSCSKIFL
jgi:hypothetical protein